MVQLKKFNLPVGAAVVDGYGDYGYVQRIHTNEFGETVVDVYYLETHEYPAGIYEMDPASLEVCTGCECGNPFTLCHPEA